MIKYLSEMLQCCYDRNKNSKTDNYTRCGVCRHKILKKQTQVILIFL